MGRIRVFLCAFCLDRNTDQATNEHTFNRDIDVSHLATPHISSNLSTPACSTPVCEGAVVTNNNNEEIRNNNHHHHHSNQNWQQEQVGQSLASNQSNQGLEQQSHQNRAESSEEDFSHHSVSQQQDNGRPQPSPQVSDSSPLNAPSPALERQQQQLQNIMNIQALQQQQQALAYDLAGTAGYRGTTRLSYDIISVREPLAKILVERQQQLQRQNLGDHDYIEVYGERGSSCFYEEIAGSTTSSATYDQIGANSNHNYQVLVNAYAAVANRPNGSNHNNNSVERPINQNASSSSNGHASNNENLYDVTYPTDQVDASAASNIDPQPSTSSAQFNRPSTSHQATTNEQSNPQPNPVPADRTSILAESIPVYSVINKATRRSNAIIRATIDSCRPPQPPPKNLMLVHQPSTSAIHQDTPGTSLIGNNRSSPQIPTTSSYSNNSNNNSESSDNPDRSIRLPQPPPRLSKFGAPKSTTSRPLPLPDDIDLEGASTAAHRNQPQDYDLESISNGYELLRTNVFDDDQIDVGYEKIRESNRYSGGSLSMPFRPLQAIDNGGYESVHPIYSSPSNALVEPNYEAIGPATASELAAAATARLTAAAATIEQLLKQDQ